MADSGPTAELELTRTPDDRRRYVVEGLGSLRLEGFLQHRAVVEAAGRRWSFRRTSRWGRRVEATDGAGAVVGDYEPRRLRRGGTVRWGQRRYVLRASSFWRTRYTLADGDRELLLVDGRGWGRRPVRLTLDPEAAVDPVLVLFAAFVVHGIARDDGAAVAAVS